MLYERMNGELARAGFNLKIEDKASYQSAVAELRATSNQEERIKEKIVLDELARRCSEIANILGRLSEEVRHIGAYNTLVEARSEVAQLNIHEFLRLGSELIDHRHVSSDECPFCLTDYNLGQLREEVDGRMQLISDVKTRLAAASGSVDRLIATMSQAKSMCELSYLDISLSLLTASCASTLLACFH